MILFFDTETTGLPDNRIPPGDQRQPHLVQLACLLTDDDGAERSHANLIVNPGVPIPKRASDVHGITDEIAERAGVSSRVAVAIWNTLADRADLIVAHNIKFDLAIIETAWIRTTAKLDFEQKHGSRGRFCTMEASSPIVNLPPTERMIAAGFDKPKSPKLEEAIKHFFGETLDGAHDAMVDMRACARLYFHLQSIKAAA